MTGRHPEVVAIGERRRVVEVPAIEDPDERGRYVQAVREWFDHNQAVHAKSRAARQAAEEAVWRQKWRVFS